MEWLKLKATAGIDPDTLTLDQFVGLTAKLELLRMWQSDDEQERNGLGIIELERQMEVAKAAGVPGGII